MNGTFIFQNVTKVSGVIYSTGEKTFLGFIPAFIFIIGVAMYKYVRRPLLNSESTANRLDIFYNHATGIIWGQFFFHYLPNATTYGQFGYKLRSLFVLLGYGAMLGYDKLSRISSDNVNFVAPSTVSSDYTLKRGNQEEADYIIMDGSADGSDNWKITEELKELRNRRIIAYIYYVMATFNCFADGLFIIYNSAYTPHILLLALFLVDKVMKSIALFTVLIHAKMYAKRNWRRKLFYALLVGWPLIVLASLIPTFCNINVAQACAWINHIALGIFYGIFAGIMLWYANHFQHMESDNITKKQLRISFVVFIEMALASWLTGYFI